MFQHIFALAVGHLRGSYKFLTCAAYASTYTCLVEVLQGAADVVN